MSIHSDAMFRALRHNTPPPQAKDTVEKSAS
jgi:hypothetical protein